MKNCTFLLLSFFSIISGWAQTPNWAWAYNYEAFNSDTRSLTATASNGDVYLIGNFLTPTMAVGSTTLTNSGGNNSGDLYIIKYSSSGTILWVKKEGGLHMDSITSIATDTNGNFYLLGNFVIQITLGATTLNQTYNGPFLAKYDALGNVVWARKIANEGENCIPTRIKADPLGNIYLTGYYRSPVVTFDAFVITDDNYIPTVGGSAFIVKYNSSGNVLWAKGTQRTGSTVFSNISFDVAFDSNGNVYIGGYFFSATMQFDTITLTNPSSPLNSIFMTKYDSNGTVLWAKTPVITSPNNFINTITTDASGNVYFSGSFVGTMTFDSGTISTPGSEMIVVKYNSSGTYQWVRTVTGSGYSAVDSSDVDSSGNLYVTGPFLNSSINFGNGVIGSNSGEGAIFVTKYNPDGTPQWVKTAGSLNINNRITLDCFNENEIYIAGYFFNSNINFGTISLTKTATSNPNIFIAKLYNTPLSSETFTTADFQAVPNPVEDWLRFSEIDGKYNYYLMDGVGKKIATGELTNIENSISFTGYLAGLYFLEIQNEQGEKIIKRILKK